VDVAVVVPAYNARRTIGEALASAFGQTLPPTQVIVVDDGSTDGTADEVARAFPAVRLLATPNQGPSAARNAALAVAQAEWVAFLDADDVWHPEKLRLQADLLAGHPDVAIAATAWTRGDPPPLPDRCPPATRLGWRDIARMNAFQTSTGVVRRSLALAVGGFRPAYDGAEDWDFWLRAATVSDVLYLPLPLVRYRDTPGGVSRDVGRVYRRGVAMLRDWQAHHRLLEPAAFRRLLVWQHVRFAYNLWREGDRPAALAALRAGAREATWGEVARVVTGEFLPYLAGRALRRAGRVPPRPTPRAGAGGG
jgi:glycosyltransferase involved in cell wall biosynthesis